MEWEILMTTQVEAFLDDFVRQRPGQPPARQPGPLGPGAQRPGRGQAAGGHGDGGADRQHERAEATVGRAEQHWDVVVFDPWRSAVLLVAGTSQAVGEVVQDGDPDG
jgi:hypothetical protein